MSDPSAEAFVVGGEVFFDPHPGRQVEVLRLLRDRVLGRGEAPANVFLWGNRGSGKSRLVRSFLHAVAMAVPGFRYVVVRRNMPDLRKNHLIYLGKEMRTLGGDYHQTHGQANYANGSIGFYAQCETEEDAEKIVGAEAAVLYVDEAPQIKWELLRLLAPSLRVARVDGRQPYRTCAIYGGNPVGESIEELWKYFIDQDVDPEEDPEYYPQDFRAIEMRRSDNPSIDESEYRKQFAGLPAHYRKAWLDGVRMESRTLFDVRKVGADEKPYHYIQELPTVDGVPLLQVPWIQVYRAFDMGFFPDPAVCLWIAVLGRRVIVFHEETWFRTVAKDLAKAMVEITEARIGAIPVGMTYVDPQIAVKTGSDTVTVMDTLEIHGVPCEPSINDRVLYADAIHGLLGEEVAPGVPRLQIYEPGCPMLAKYLPKMRWDEKHPRKMADHRFDHWIVALAYFGISSGVLSLAEKATAPAVEPQWMQWIRESEQRRSYRRRA